MKIEFLHSFGDDSTTYKQFALLPTIVIDFDTKAMIFYFLFAGIGIDFKKRVK